MKDTSDALKLVAAYSDYEFKESKLMITFAKKNNWNSLWKMKKIGWYKNLIIKTH